MREKESKMEWKKWNNYKKWVEVVDLWFILIVI